MAQFELNPSVAEDLAAVSAAFRELAHDELRHLLRQQHDVVDGLRAQWSSARASHEEANQVTLANDRFHADGAGSWSWPDATSVGRVTATLAAEMIEDVRSTMHVRWLAWWADTAILAVDGGGVVDRFRAAATSPQWLLQPHQVAMVRRLSSAENDGSTALPENMVDPEGMRSMLWGRALDRASATAVAQPGPLHRPARCHNRSGHSLPIRDRQAVPGSPPPSRADDPVAEATDPALAAAIHRNHHHGVSSTECKVNRACPERCDRK